MTDTAVSPTKKRELTVFLFLTLVLAPVLAVIIVAGYGFCVWMYQIIMGPPSVAHAKDAKDAKGRRRRIWLRTEPCSDPSYSFSTFACFAFFA
jgi:nitrate reductase NapE